MILFLCVAIQLSLHFVENTGHSSWNGFVTFVNIQLVVDVCFYLASQFCSFNLNIQLYVSTMLC